jgi:hypothetical protein
MAIIDRGVFRAYGGKIPVEGRVLLFVVKSNDRISGINLFPSS